MPKPWSRRSRRDADRARDDTVDLADSEEHAWWAARDHLDGVTPPLRPEPEPARDDPEPADPGPPPADPPQAETTSAGRSFNEVFSTESLFTWGTRPRQDEPAGPDHESEEWWEGTDPYVVLGVQETASWEEITAAHRRLAKLHHPDRLLRATEEDRERSERRMRELNIAYSELRRRRGR